MRVNIGRADRLLRIGAGAAAVVLGFARDWPIAVVVGALLVASGAIGWCAVHAALRSVGGHEPPDNHRPSDGPA